MARSVALDRGRDVRRVLREGRHRASDLMVVYVVPGGGQTRVAFVCGRRLGGAVIRNRGRRVLREAWRALSPRATEPFDIVFVARPDIRGAKTQDVIADMSRQLAAAGVTE
ncbi:MAG TPA: ribonuclease P protein component [Actinomycetota bacterium]|nr:ribonuclease P protein component [Actinomycetota bacterium]